MGACDVRTLTLIMSCCSPQRSFILEMVRFTASSQAFFDASASDSISESAVRDEVTESISESAVREEVMDSISERATRDEATDMDIGEGKLL